MMVKIKKEKKRLVAVMEILFATSITYNMTNGEGIVMLELKMKQK